MKNFKVLFMLAGLSTGLVASEGNGSADFMSKFAAQLTSFYNTAATKSSEFGSSALTAGNDYLVKPLSQAGSTIASTVSNATTATLNAGNDYVVKPVSDATSKAVTAISNSSVAKSASEFGSSVAKSASDATTVVTTKASEFGSAVAAKSADAAAYVSKSASATYDSSAKFCEENPVVVGAALFTATVVTFLAYMKYQQDGYLFYANEEASDADQA